MPRRSANPHLAGVGPSEHISLESDVGEVRAPPNPNKPLVQFRLSRGGRGLTTRVCILPDQYISVETQRTRSATALHSVDMRFIDPRPIGIRKVPWSTFYVALGLTLLTGLMIAVGMLWPNVMRVLGGSLTTSLCGLAAIIALAICYYFTKESLVFLSLHGRARLVVISGRLGTIRRSHHCAVELASHINVAKRKFEQKRQAFLRDEMREHARLHEQGVLTAEQYEEAKRRILKAHA